jgi:hypothetical protein
MQRDDYLNKISVSVSQEITLRLSCVSKSANDTSKNNRRVL